MAAAILLCPKLVNSSSSVKETLGVKVGFEGAETDELEYVNSAMIDKMYETESDTSDEEAKIFILAFC